MVKKNRQEYLPGMNIEGEAIRAVVRRELMNKSYKCPMCKSVDKTITWDCDTELFSCFTCGYVDKTRTAEIRNV